MKPAICALLAACVVSAVFAVFAAADEPKQPVAAAAAAQDQAAAQGQSVKPDALPPELAALLQGLDVRPVVVPGPTCYFIRTIRPVTDDPMKTGGFIPLQARVTGHVREPDCTDGTLGRTTPVVTGQSTTGLKQVALPEGKAGR